MTSLNKVMLVGRLGRGPEIRYTKSGQAVANFSVATSEKYKDQAGAKQEKTEWHRIVCWSKQAEFASQYFRKGMLVYVEGRLQTNSFEKEGVKHYSTEIVAHQISFMEPKGAGDNQVPEQSQDAPQAQSAEPMPWD